MQAQDSSPKQKLEKPEMNGSGDYVLLVDETGIDGKSAKVYYVGCLLEAATIGSVTSLIENFNKNALKNPARSGNKSWVNAIEEARHFDEDHFTLREQFIWDVLTNIPCRVYVVSMDYAKNNVQEIKKTAFTELIRIAQSTKRVLHLQVIAEQGEIAFQRDFPEVAFKDKSFLPLSVPDYYAAGIKAFHDLRLRHEAGEQVKEDESSITLRFYKLMGSTIAFEYDISTKQSSSRRQRTYLKSMKKML